MTDELKTENINGVVVKRVKIQGGEEVTIQVNDPDDEAPISGPYGGFSQEVNAQGKKDFEDAQNEESKEDDAENKHQAVKAQQNKPSAVSTKSTATK